MFRLLKMSEIFRDSMLIQLCLCLCIFQIWLEYPFLIRWCVSEEFFSFLAFDVGGMQTTLKPLLYLILCSFLLDLKVRVTSRFIILVLNDPPKPMASSFDSGRKEQSTPIKVASFSEIAEKTAPVSIRKSIILPFLYEGDFKEN